MGKPCNDDEPIFTLATFHGKHYIIGMSRVFFILMIIAMVLVLLSLIAGLIGMVKGGEFNEKYGNKLMRARVTLQGVALGLFVLAVLSQNSE